MQMVTPKKIEKKPYLPPEFHVLDAIALEELRVRALAGDAKAQEVLTARNQVLQRKRSAGHK